MLKISIIGCGAIGSEIAEAIDKKIIPAELVSVYDIIPEKAYDLISTLKNSNPVVAKNLTQSIKLCDIAVECASQTAVKEIAKIAFPLKKDIFVLSVGALITYNWILKSAKEFGCRVYFPSGAVAGLDGLKAATFGKIKDVVLITRKPARTLIGKDINKEKIIFEGTAREAVQKFPVNINVAATISLVGIGPKKTKVKIIADPKIKRNIHEIEITGDFGKIITRAENVPSLLNPKTSYLATLSTISELKQIAENIKKKGQ